MTYTRGRGVDVAVTPMRIAPFIFGKVDFSLHNLKNISFDAILKNVFQVFLTKHAVLISIDITLIRRFLKFHSFEVVRSP